MQIVGLSQTVRPQVHDIQVPVILPSVKNKKEKRKRKDKRENVTSLIPGLHLTFAVLLNSLERKSHSTPKPPSPKSMTNDLIKSAAQKYRGMSGAAFIYLLVVRSSVST